jgi:hypothetical protein
MKKLLPLAAIFLLWATSAIAGDLTPYPGSFDGNPFFLTYQNSEPEKEIEIFPNPVTGGQVTIKASESILSVQILNITGKIVLSEEYEPNTTTVVVELTKLEKGIYLVRIGFTGKITHTEKIMIK